MQDIVIVNEYIEEMKKFCGVQGTRYEAALFKYVSILQELNAQGIVRGQTADALRAFLEAAASLRGRVTEISTLFQQLMGNYLTDIDEADRELY